eukprot:3335660-Amphidinium_carterae.1
MLGMPGTWSMPGAFSLFSAWISAQRADVLTKFKGKVLGWSEDARDYFYLLKYADIRHTETIIGYNVPVAEFELDSLKVPRDWTEFALALVSPADQKAMEIAQLRANYAINM